MIRDYTAATALLLAALGLQVVEPVMADLPPGFTDQSVAEFTSPKDFVFLRDFSESELDDTMLVLLQHGTVMRIRGATSTTPEVDTYMEIGSNNVMGYQEDGAISIIVDPAFSTNGHFYVYYTRPEHPDDLRPGELGGNGRRQRISRFTYDDTCSIDTCVSATVLGSTPSQNVQECVCGTEEIIWEADEQASHGLGRHSAGGMGIGPDGMLYLAIGDNGNTQIQAKNPCNTYGSVIRVSPDPADLGTPPAGNPIWVFSDLSSHPDLPNSCDPAAGVGDAGYCLGCLPGGDSTQNFVYAIGLRNPFRASWEGSRFIIGEVGEGNFEDIHAMNQPGLNFRWPYCAGPCEGSGCDAVDCYADGEEPIHSYAHEVTNSYPMGIGGFGESLTGGFIYHVDDPPLDHQFPADPYDGVYFFANWGDYPFLNYLEFDQNGDVTVDQEGNTIMHDFANGDQTLPNAIGQVIALAQGPDGAIYYIDRGGDGDGVRRIAYNLSPTIESVSVDPRSSAEAPLTVSLDALATDPESDPVYYRWLITPPVGSIIVAENVGDETDPALTQALNAPGVYSIRVEARDDLNLSTAAVNASDPILVEVGRRPIPTMLSPEPCSLFQAGDTIQLSGEAFDPNDPEGSEDLAYDWSVVLLRDQGAGGSIPIPIGETQVNDSGTTVASFDIDSLGDLDFEVFKGLEFRLTVSDNPEGAGLSETVATRIYAKRASFPVDSDPCGFMVQFGPDHVRLSTPAEYSAMVGQEFTFGFDDSDVDLACVLNERYEFSEWSDDPLLESIRTITVPAGLTTNFSADFVSTGLPCEPPYASDLALHLVAGAGVSTTGSDVDSWADQAGAHLLSSTGAARPTLTTNAINGLPAIHFDGVDDLLDRVEGGGVTNDLPIDDDLRTVVMVVKYDSVGWGGFTYGPDSTSTIADNSTFGPAVDDNGFLAIQGWGTADYSSTTQGAGQGWLIQTVSRTDFFGGTFHYLDDLEIDSTGVTWATDDSEIRIGAMFDESNFVTMDVAEILVYNRGLNVEPDGTLPVVWEFLQDKYLMVGDAPSPQVDVASTRPARTVDIDLLFNDCDPDGALVPASIAITAQPIFGSVSVSNGVATYDPLVGAGTDMFQYTVEDDDGNVSEPTLVTVEVGCPLINCNEVIYVNGAAGGQGDGKTWGTAFQFLGEALAVDCPGDEIWVAKGTYVPDESAAFPSGTNDRNASFHLDKGVGLYGGFDGTELSREDRDVESNVTVLSGDLIGDDDFDLVDPFTLHVENAYHVITASGTDTATILDGFVIQSGNANDLTPASSDGFGGGMLIDGIDPMNDSGSPTVRNCVFKYNAALIGGASSVNGGSPRFSDCSFITNKARDFGGAIYSVGGESVPLFSEISIVNCRFVDNVAGDPPSSRGDGGAIWADEAAPTIVGCEFYNNRALVNGNGGAIATRCELNCTRLTNIVNCTIVDNEAAGNGEGGGIYVGSSVSTPTAEILNSILWSNTSAGEHVAAEQIAIAEGSDATVQFSCVQDDEAGDETLPFHASNIDVEPNFMQRSVGNLRVYKGSATIDAGQDSYLSGPLASVTTDRDGTPRFIDDPSAGSSETVDIGAYEEGYPSILQGRVDPLGNNISFSNAAFSYYIDPRRESSDGSNVNQGIDAITIVFSEQVRDVGGVCGELSASSFTIEETGSATPPAIMDVLLGTAQSTHSCVVPLDDDETTCGLYNEAGPDDAGLYVVGLRLDRAITIQEWTTIKANVESCSGAGIDGSDRIIVGFLPADLDPNGDVQALDLLRMRQALLGSFPFANPEYRGSLEDYGDIDRNGSVQAIDLLNWRQLWFGTGNATQAWQGAEMNNSRPAQCCP